MKRVLTLSKYLRGNPAKILPLSSTVCLAVAFCYFVMLLRSNIIMSNETLDLAPYTHMSLVSGTSEDLSPEQKASDLEQLQTAETVETYFFANLSRINYATPTADHAMNLFYMTKSDIATVLGKEDLSLTQGAMPQESGEVIVHEEIARKYQLSVGDKVEENRIGWPVREPLRVVGLFSGKGMMAFAAEDQEVIQQNTSVVLCYPREGRAIMNEFLETTFGSRYELVTYERISDVIDESRDAIGGITIFIGIVIVITLITLLSNILLTQYAQREKELQLLFALGYTKRRIAFSVFREIGAANMTGYIAGILLGVVVAWLTNICLIMDKAFYLELFDPLMVIGVSLIPVVVTCMCILAPLRYVREDTQL